MRLIREEKTFIREAVLLMLPMILQNFVTFSMSMADTFMVGVLGETALAAVTMANSPFYVMQLMIFGVQSGMSVLVAQYHGRGDQEAINRVMGIALFVSTTITGLLAITAFCIPEQIMRVLTNNADLVAPGAAYTRYVGFSYFFSAIKMAIPMSIIGAAIGEWLGAQSGLGYFSRRMMTQLDGAGVFAPIVLLSAVAMVAVALVALLEKKVVRWRGEF